VFKAKVPADLLTAIGDVTSLVVYDNVTDGLDVMLELVGV